MDNFETLLIALRRKQAAAWRRHDERCAATRAAYLAVAGGRVGHLPGAEAARAAYAAASSASLVLMDEEIRPFRVACDAAHPAP